MSSFEFEPESPSKVELARDLKATAAAMMEASRQRDEAMRLLQVCTDQRDTLKAEVERLHRAREEALGLLREVRARTRTSDPRDVGLYDKIDALLARAEEGHG